MMKVRLFQRRVSRGFASVSLGTILGIGLGVGLSGCVSYGNTHALLTPVGVAGYHTFKPDHTATPRDINFPDQRTPDRPHRPDPPNRVAATNEPNEQ